MAFYSYTPSGVCSRQIVFELDDGKLSNIKFTGGCPGNLAAISKLLDGADAAETVKKLQGNDCGGRGTSCADQLAIAVSLALQEQEAKKGEGAA
ncbi:MAG: TIGR03905 family TSCPD domain-containing protein [Synergistaceae bacterium]|nr:TIGR03905 family TSCPD domain-containing protein [Synergistaceae bacterium]MBR1603737.1 TIGR03905 family TSCPD domain-containing protein [Synergistaceae bacterium]